MKEQKSMQPVKFQKISELFGFLPEDQLVIVQHLRSLVLDCLPGIKERLSYNIPFYSLHKGICYIWPGAVAWGSKTREGVEFGFNYGYLLNNESGYLQQGNRKQVTSKHMVTIEEIDEDLLRMYLLEAAEIDELMYREKIHQKKNS